MNKFKSVTHTALRRERCCESSERCRRNWNLCHSGCTGKSGGSQWCCVLGGVPELCIVQKALKQALASQLLSHSTKTHTHKHTHTHEQQQHRKSRIIESYGKTKLASWILHRQIIIHKEKEELHHETLPQP
jgi:hypothetical protein